MFLSFSNCPTLLFLAAWENSVVTVLVLTASLAVAVVIQNGEWVRRGYDARLCCQNADAVPGGAEEGGGSRAPFTVPAPVVRFSCSRKGAAVIVNILVRRLLPCQKRCLSSQPRHRTNPSLEALRFLFRPTIPWTVFFQGNTSSFLSLHQMTIFFSVDLASSLTTTDHILLLECTLPLSSNFGCSTGSTHWTCPLVVPQFPHQNPGHDLGHLSLP